MFSFFASIFNGRYKNGTNIAVSCCFSFTRLIMVFSSFMYSPLFSVNRKASLFHQGKQILFIFSVKSINTMIDDVHIEELY